MATPLTDSINALTTYANEVTGGSDTNLSDAVHTLASGYGGGGASSWTKVAETSYQVSTTSTTSTVVAMWETGHSEILTTEKILYVRIRDTAGKRTGYFYGSDNFFINVQPNTEYNNTGIRNAHRYTTGQIFVSYGTGGTIGYGVYVDTVYSDGRIRIRERYSSTNSYTIDGTYKVEVYLLAPPTGAPIIE